MYKSVDAKLRMLEVFESEMKSEVEAGRAGMDAANRPDWIDMEGLVRYHWY